MPDRRSSKEDNPERNNTNIPRGGSKSHINYSQGQNRNIYMSEIGNRTRISEYTPPMSDPLMELLQYNGKPPYGNQLILCPAPDLH